MKSIVFFNTNQAWGGGEKWHLNMAISLKAQNFKVTVICQEDGELAKHAKANELNFIPLKLGNLSFLNPFKILQVKKILTEIKAECIFLNLPRDVKICAPIAKILKIDKIIYRRGMPHPLKNNWLNRFLFKRVDYFIANSLEIKRSIIKNFPQLESKVKVIYNGVIPKVMPSHPRQDILILGNIGRLVEQKGHKDLIQVAAILKQKNFPFKLYIAGTGPLQDELEQKIKQLQLNEQVELLGHRPAEEVFGLIDFFIFTSHFEGSANALIEALLYQKPIIAYNISSNPEVVENGHEGILIPAFDIEKMANAVMELSIQKNLCESFQKNAKAKIETKFNYQNKVKEVIELVNL